MNKSLRQVFEEVNYTDNICLFGTEYRELFFYNYLKSMKFDIYDKLCFGTKNNECIDQMIEDFRG